MKILFWFALAISVWGCGVSNLLAEEPGIKRIVAPGESAGLPQVAVVVDDVALAHTAQLFPVDAEGKLLGGEDLKAQVEQLGKNYEHALMTAGSSREKVVKLNFYAATPELAMALQDLFLFKAMKAESSPAISLVVTPLPFPGALIAVDAIAVMPPPPPGSKGGNPTSIVRHPMPKGVGSERAGYVSVLPRGDVMYVSGQAEPGDSIHAAAKATFEGLLRTLKEYKLEPRNIVQFKAFLDPMEKAEEVEQALAELMPEGTMPPLVFVQWEAPGTVEIEMIATAADLPVSDDDETVSYLTPPWMDSSPNFSRIARVHGREIVYFPGLYSSEAGDGAEQVNSVFKQLGTLAKLAGTDYEHLAKATYYVADDDASMQLNKLRPNYYNPKRPPAASKAAVKSVGRAERSLTMDMIGVVPK